MQNLPLGQRQPDLAHHFAQGFELVDGGFLMHTVKQRLARGLQRFSGADIGQHHAFFDQLVGIEAVTKGHGSNLARLIQHDLAFGQVQVQGLAAVAFGLQRLIGGPEGFDGAFQHRRCRRIGIAIGGGLGLFVRQGRMAAHQPALEFVAKPGTLGVQHDAQGNTGAVDIAMQAAQIARKRVGQHGHNAVGKVAGIAALQRLAVERAAGAHIMGDIGNRHPQDMATGIGGVVIRHRGDSVIAVARIGRVDGDQREVAQIGALAKLHGFGSGGGLDHLIGEGVGDAMFMNGNQRHGLWRARVANAGDDARLAQAHTVFGSGRLGLDQFAIACAISIAHRHLIFVALALAHGQDAPAMIGLAEHADNARGRLGNAANGAGMVGNWGGGIHRLGLGQNPVTPCQCRGRGVGQDQRARRGGLACPHRRAGQKLAIVGLPVDDQHSNRGQHIRIGKAAALLFQMPLIAKRAQHGLKLDTRSPLDAKSLGDIALGGGTRVFADEFQQLVFRGHFVHAPPLARRLRPVMRIPNGCVCETAADWP